VVEMSLSKKELSFGKVIVGLETKSVEEVEYKPTYIPPEEVERRVLAGAKKKAKEKAKEILNQALREAKAIKEKAFQEGYLEGQKQARAELDKLKQDLAQKWITFFDSLEQEKQKIYAEYKEDLLLLLRKAVQKITYVVLSEEKNKILESFLKEAVDYIQNKKEVVVKINPQNKELVLEILESIKKEYPSLNVCQVKEDASLEDCAVIVENGNGLVENRLSSRLKQIEEILAKIELK